VVNNVRIGIRDALEEKGVEMSGVPFTEFPAKVAGISVGGNAEFINFLQGSSSVTLPDGLTFIGDRVFRDNFQITAVTIPEGVTEIRGEAFANSRISALSLPNSLETVGWRAFAGIPLWDARFGSEIRTINGAAFADCPNLRSIRINRPAGSVSGAPWGASGADVIWTG